MIDVEAVLEALPHFETFCSVERLTSQADDLRSDPRFAVTALGASRGGRPIVHIKAGAGRLKALIVGGPHAMEPIGSLTVFGLLDRLKAGEPSLWEADVEWHVVPCIDPDGAALNEGWTQQPYDIENYIKNFYVQSTADMVDTSFPVRHKALEWSQPSHEADLLKTLIDRLRPDYYYGLHNAWIGGTFFFISRDIGAECYRRLHALLEREDFPVQRRPLWKEVCEQYAEGVVEMIDVTKHYDYVERTSPHPEKVVQYGASSRYHLTQIKPDALTFVTEMGYVRHPADESEAPTGLNLRKFQLQIEAGAKHLAVIMLEAWEEVRDELDAASPYYRSIEGGLVFPLDRERILQGGMPLAWYPTRNMLFTRAYDREMTEADQFNACMINGGAAFLRISHQFIRLLEASPQTPGIVAARARVGRAFDEALEDIRRHVDLGAFQVVPCDVLARVQLGSGLIVLNTLLEQAGSA